MNSDHISIVLLSTLKCNADCDYCFEEKASAKLTHEQLTIIMEKVFDYMDERAIGALTLHWQGGEAMLLPPTWYEEAYQLIGAAADRRSKQVDHGLQTNMLLYHERWNNIIKTMFGNSISTSVDYPNLHRRLPGQGTENYNVMWHDNVCLARASGIDVKVISVPNHGTLEVGAERFYNYFTEEIGVFDFQINTPFPGGETNDVKESMPLPVDQLTRFYLDLADIWLERGVDQGVLIGPFDELLNWFNHDPSQLPCIWSDNCTNHIVSIDPRGNVAQCDCWVTSYPDYNFGNIFDSGSFAELLEHSPARKKFKERPVKLMQRDCIECDYLTLCHGGCPVRTYTVRDSLFEKDPYCELYKGLFSHMQQAVPALARRRQMSSGSGLLDNPDAIETVVG